MKAKYFLFPPLPLNFLFAGYTVHFTSHCQLASVMNYIIASRQKILELTSCQLLIIVHLFCT